MQKTDVQLSKLPSLKFRNETVGNHYKHFKLDLLLIFVTLIQSQLNSEKKH